MPSCYAGHERMETKCPVLKQVTTRHTVLHANLLQQIFAKVLALSNSTSTCVQAMACESITLLNKIISTKTLTNLHGD